MNILIIYFILLIIVNIIGVIIANWRHPMASQVFEEISSKFKNYTEDDWREYLSNKCFKSILLMLTGIFIILYV